MHQSISHRCGLCAEEFSLSAALFLHKVKCHTEDFGNGKVYSFFDELLNEETVHSSDDEFDYTFMIITSVMQTPKEYFRVEEPSKELQNLEIVKLEISEHNSQLVSTAIQPEDPTKTTCRLCGKEKSTKNMRRHMLLVHKIEIGRKYQTVVDRAASNTNTTEDEPTIDQMPSNMACVDDPLQISENQQKNAINVKNEIDSDTTISTPIICDEQFIKVEPAPTGEIVCVTDDDNTTVERLSVPKLNSESQGTIKCPLCNFKGTYNLRQHIKTAHTGQHLIHPLGYVLNSTTNSALPTSSSSKKKLVQATAENRMTQIVSKMSSDTNLPALKPFHFRCPLCLRPGHYTNIKRHLKRVHNQSKEEIYETLKLIDMSNFPKQKSATVRFQTQCPTCDFVAATASHMRVHFAAVHFRKDDANRADETSKTSTFEFADMQSQSERTHQKLPKSAHQAAVAPSIVPPSSPIPQTPPVTLIERLRRMRACTCTLCKTEFPSRPLIMQHFTTEHADAIDKLVGERFDCDVCPIVLDSFATYESHQTQKHMLKPQQTAYLCNHCGKYKSSFEALTVHIGTHTNARLYACDVCHKRFNAKSTLVEHILVHSGEKRYVCPVDGCNAAYAQRAGLTQHKLLRHATEKRHQCEFCGQKFPLLRYLKNHRRIHTGMRPYQCDKCAKCFRVEKGLRMHLLVHSGFRPHRCEPCNKGFYSTRHLKCHRASQRCWTNRNLGTNTGVEVVS